jgi:ribulose-phosphate 3-epimerase
MKTVIIPAVLSKTKEELKSSLEKIQPFSNWVQIDVADGEFVSNKTISLKEIIDDISLKKLIKNFNLELHLMIYKPEDILDLCQKLNPKRVYIHFEALKSIDKLKKILKNFSFELGLAINPDTRIDSFKFLVDFFNSYLFMTVYPGFQGQKFISDVLKKIKEFKQFYPNKIVEIDGGINEETAKLIDSKIDFVVSGSYILKANNPKKNYQKLIKMIND